MVLNGKSRNHLQTVLLALALLFIIIKEIIIPQVGAGKNAGDIIIERRFTQLETNYANIEKLLTEIRKDLRDHMTGEK